MSSVSNFNFLTLLENDMLLKNKINTIVGERKYSQIIHDYFQLIDNLEPQGCTDLSLERSKHVTDTLRKLWVIIHQKEATFEFFKNYENLEKLLLEDKNYRGHYIHQFNVFLLGYFMLNKIEKEYSDIWRIFKRFSNEPYFTWMLASTFHDMGYPLQKIDDWFSRYLDMFLKVDAPYEIEIERLLSPIFFEYVKFIAQAHAAFRVNRTIVFGQNEKRDWHFQNLLLKELRKKDHGVLSSILLIHSFLTQEKFSHSDTWLISDFSRGIMTACHAIALHNIQSKDIEITFKKHPFAFLLSLCDDLQDWGRSSDGYDDSELINLDLINRKGIPEMDFTIRIHERKILKKRKNLEELCKKLVTNKLINVKIHDQTSQRDWKIKTRKKSTS